MKPLYRICLLLTFMLIFNILVVACQRNLIDVEPQMPEIAENSLKTFSSLLDELHQEYEFNQFIHFDTLTMPNGPEQESSMYDLYLHSNEGVFFSFSFKQPLIESGEDLQFVFTQTLTETSQMQAHLSDSGLQSLVDGQVYKTYEFQDALTWQEGTEYGVFAYFNPKGELQINVWPMENIDQLAFVSMPAFPDQIFQVGYSLKNGQVLTLDNIWKAGQRVGLDVDLEVSSEFETDEDAEAEVVDLPQKEEEIDADIVIPAYSILDEYTKEIPGFEDAQTGSDGVYFWGARDKLHISHVNPELVNGQALLFEFEFDVLMEPSKFNIAWEMQHGSEEKVFIDIFPQIIVSENETVEFDGEMDWQAGKTYQAMFIIQNGIESIICDLSEPTQCIVGKLGSEGLEIDFSDRSKESSWNMTQYLDDSQALKMWNIKKVEIEPTKEEGNTEVFQVPQASEWNSPDDIPNLRDFYIPTINSYNEIMCSDTVESGSLHWAALDGIITVECQTDIFSGNALVYEFHFSNEIGQTTSFAMVTGEGENQKIVRFTPNFGINLKKGNEYLDEFPMTGTLGWTPGVNYTIVFVITDDYQISVWPSDHPEQMIEAVISNETLRKNFGVLEKQDAWQMRICIDNGQELFIQNLYQLEVQ